MDVEKFGKILIRSATTNEASIEDHLNWIFFENAQAVLRSTEILRTYYFQWWYLV